MKHTPPVIPTSQMTKPIESDIFLAWPDPRNRFTEFLAPA